MLVIDAFGGFNATVVTCGHQVHIHQRLAADAQVNRLEQETAAAKPISLFVVDKVYI